MKVPSLQDSSTIVGGLLIEGRLSAEDVNPAFLVEPFNKLPPYLRKHPAADREAMMGMIGISAFREAEIAAKSAPAKIDWPRILEASYRRTTTGEALIAAGKKLVLGDLPDMVKVEAALEEVITQNGKELEPLSSIKPDFEQYIESGYSPYDDFIGGLPKSGLTVIGGDTGIGKTWHLIHLSACFVRQYPKARFGVFTLEQTKGEIAARYADGEKLNEAQKKRIFVDARLRGPDEIAAIVARSDLDAVGIDYAELVLDPNEPESEAILAQVYRTFARLAKVKEIPIILLSQISRPSGYYKQPKHRFRYTGAAEQSASLAIVIHNPSEGAQQEESMPAVAGKIYLIVAKTRHGRRGRKRVVGGIGAIQVGFDGVYWGDTGSWFSFTHI